MWQKNLVFGVIGLAMVGAVIMAQARQNSEISPERYSVNEQNGGIVRVDKTTGQISFCDVKKSNVICRLGADERDAYEVELERLGEQIAVLEKQVEQSPVQTKRPKKSVPGIARKDSQFDKELDRAMDFAESAMRQFFGMVQNLKKDFEGDEI
ncbi:MAG: hypothetical protein COB78_04585 [Hyphomicrobiales bacterium]|nr:MAG: hypothetical protein COB78_04585 [Hyphomicrobiales bacterium]